MSLIASKSPGSAPKIAAEASTSPTSAIAKLDDKGELSAANLEGLVDTLAFTKGAICPLY